MPYSERHFTAYDLDHNHSYARTWYIDNEPLGDHSPVIHGQASFDADSVIVTLKLADSICSDTATHVIHIDDLAVYAPNAFTPSRELRHRHPRRCPGRTHHLPARRPPRLPHRRLHPGLGRPHQRRHPLHTGQLRLETCLPAHPLARHPTHTGRLHPPHPLPPIRNTFRQPASFDKKSVPTHLFPPCQLLAPLFPQKHNFHKTSKLKQLNQTGNKANRNIHIISTIYQPTPYQPPSNSHPSPTTVGDDRVVVGRWQDF